MSSRGESVTLVVDVEPVASGERLPPREEAIPAPKAPADTRLTVGFDEIEEYSSSSSDESTASSDAGGSSTADAGSGDNHTWDEEDEEGAPGSPVDSVSISSEESAVCRICFFGEDKRPLLKPCHCRGTIGYVHKECLQQWITRSADGKCQICHFQFTVRKEPKPFWRLLGDPTARRNVLGYLALGAVFSASIAFIFSLAWLYALRLTTRLGDKTAALLMVLLAVQNVLWHYFPFLSFMYSFDAFREWYHKNTSFKLVLNPPEPRRRWFRASKS